MKHSARVAVVGGALVASLAGAQLAWGTGSGTASAFVPIVPCRLTDSRPAPNQVGQLTSPIGQDGTVTIDIWGSHGQCIVPDSATAISANVTAVGGTAASFLTLFPAGNTLPGSSNLNWTAGAAPIPNQVDVAISDAGQLSIYNAWGSVDVIVDLVGYYEPAPSGSGPAGPAGPQGPKGDTGAAGAKGATGAAGATGAKGDSGATGAAGAKGDTGATGAAGAAGAKGDTGAPGAAGAKGDQGPQGEIGPKGDTGAKGDQGEVGPQGPNGAPGAKGDQGATGPQGEIGPKGDTGNTGATGPAGPAGAKGDTGNTGTTGATGPAGPAGNGFLSGSSGAVVNDAGGIIDTHLIEGLQTFSTVKYVGLDRASATESNVQFLVPRAMTFTTFTCRQSAGGTATTTWTLRVNGTNTSTVCTASGNNGTGSVTGTYTIPAGALVDVSVVVANGNGQSTARQVWWGLA